LRKGWKPRPAVLFGVLRRADCNVTGGGTFLVSADGEYSASGEGVAGAREREEIEGDIEEALCRKATGKPCGI
jgi:hypothetical protein